MLIALMGLAGCDFYESADFEDEYVLESYLEAGAPLQAVRVSRPAPIDGTYDFTAQAVRGAEVRLERLDAEGAVAETISYAEDSDSAGVYQPQRPATAQPRATYRLRVTTPAGDALAAQTTVPDTTSIVAASAEALPYPAFGAGGDAERLALTLSLRRTADEPTYFVLSSTALEPDSGNLVPFAGQLIAEADGDVRLEDFITNASPILNESNYDLNADGTITVEVPWIAVVFYGRNRFALRVLDQALNDLVRTQLVQQGGSTFSPGEIPNVIDNIDGGTGVFGSYAEVEHVLRVLRPGETADAVSRR